MGQLRSVHVDRKTAVLVSLTGRKSVGQSSLRCLVREATARHLHLALSAIDLVGVVWRISALIPRSLLAVRLCVPVDHPLFPFP